MTVIVPPLLRAHTVDLGDRAAAGVELLSLMPEGVAPGSVCSWLREGDGLVGWGRVAACMTTGPERFEVAEGWWTQLSAHAEVEDEVGVPGTGLVAFGSFSFAAYSGQASRLVVPQVIVGRRDGRAWMTTVTRVGVPTPDPSDPGLTDTGLTDTGLNDTGLNDPEPASSEPAEVTLAAGSVPAEDWPGVVAAALDRIEAGSVDKVVLARDVVATSTAPFQVRQILSRLADRYTATWTFAVDGLIGATPEMLVRLLEGRVRSRVLAGTLRRDGDPAPLVTETHPELSAPHHSDPRLRLISSDKDLEEHAYAVRSVADVLAAHCRDLEVPDEPFVLELPDVFHLASDLSAVAVDGVTSLRLAAALHPSAAVCGTPAAAAARVIAELEGMDRGRYAGPVGWIDSSGEGDWGIALRCGELSADGTQMRLFAGGGVVAASDPEAELAETEVKLAAMRYALDC